MPENLEKDHQKSTSKYNWGKIFLAVKAGGVGVLISNITMWTIYTRKKEEGRGGGNNIGMYLKIPTEKYV